MRVICQTDELLTYEHANVTRSFYFDCDCYECRRAQEIYEEEYVRMEHEAELVECCGDPSDCAAPCGTAGSSVPVPLDQITELQQQIDRLLAENAELRQVVERSNDIALRAITTALTNLKLSGEIERLEDEIKFLDEYVDLRDADCAGYAETVRQQDVVVRTLEDRIDEANHFFKDLLYAAVTGQKGR